jgi:hypothetical protein
MPRFPIIVTIDGIWKSGIAETNQKYVLKTQVYNS